MNGRIDEAVAELGAVLETFLETRGAVFEAAVAAVTERLRAGGRLLVFGNGGSAAEAQHFAAELVNGLSMKDRDRTPLAAVALTTDTSALTAIGNDRGFEHVFSRQIAALGQPGDVALALTASGTSENILEGLEEARSRGLLTVVLSGNDGGASGPRADHLLDVPSRSTPRIQEAHLFLLHLIAERLERI
jgi:D-sedoheptulose 7-phosphate isomerase